MNKDQCVKDLLDIIQDSEYYESDIGTSESYKQAKKRNENVIQYIMENLK